MTYKYELIKSNEVTTEEFESAFNCAITSIESVLYEQNVKIESEIPYILITQDNEGESFSLPKCKELLKGCFTDSSGNIYDEFQIIKVSEPKST
jgi:hypothetical protein